jgi:tetratricopeptide (TPR) repeat protein
VRARKPTLAYRAGKLVTRRPLGVATGTAFALLLGASAAVTLHQNSRIREQAARVSRERDKALQAQAFLLEMFGATGPDEATGDTVTARELLDRRASNLEGAYPDPETRAEMMAVLAEGYDKLGVLDRAEPLARSALALRRALPSPPVADIATSLDVLGWILHERGNEVEAESKLRESVALGRSAFGEDGDPRLARALNDLGTLREAAGDYEEAAALYRESLAMRRRFLGEAHVGVPTTMSNLSVVLYRMGDLDGAVEMGRSALDRFRQIVGPDHQRTLLVQTNLAAMESTRGDHAAAAEEHRELLGRRKRLFGARHPTVVQSMTLLANELVQLDRAEEADSLLRGALEIATGLYGPRHESVADALRVLGDLEARTDRPAAALDHFRQTEDILRALRGRVHQDVAMLRARIASAKDALGDTDAALADYEEAVRISEQAVGPRHPRTISILLSLVELLIRDGRRMDAATRLDDLEADLGAGGDAIAPALRHRIDEVRALLSDGGQG